MVFKTWFGLSNVLFGCAKSWKTRHGFYVIMKHVVVVVVVFVVMTNACHKFFKVVRNTWFNTIYLQISVNVTCYICTIWLFKYISSRYMYL